MIQVHSTNADVDDPSIACGHNSNCINRELNIECPANNCSTGPFCQNQRFQLKQYAQVEIFKTPMKGHGLRSKANLRRYSILTQRRVRLGILRRSAI